MAKPSRDSRARRAREPRSRRAWLLRGGSRFTLGLVLGGAVVGGLLLWSAFRSGDLEPVAVGEPVESFQLLNVVTGQPFEVGADLGREPIVVVSYMGFF